MNMLPLSSISAGQTYFRCLIKSLAVFGVISAVNVCYGQGSVGIDIDHLTRQGVDERLQSDGVDLMGDQIDMNTGSVVFRHVDVSIPGNSHLPVAVSRSRTVGRRWGVGNEEFADWQIDLPRIKVIVAQERHQNNVLDPPEWRDQRCTAPNFLGPKLVSSDPYWVPNFFDPNNDFPDIYIVEDHEYSNGVTLEIPGEGSRQVLDIGQQNLWPSGAEKVTTDNWYFTCILATDPDVPAAGGEGFYGHAPNGDVYTFNQLVYRTESKIDVAQSFLERRQAIMLATKVTDVAGNWVEYTYSGGKPTLIKGNDGREIGITYTSNRVSKVTTNPGAPFGDEREWTYTYTTVGRDNLDTVTLPDGRSWDFNLLAMDLAANPKYDCTRPAYTVTMTHPNGAVGNFTFTETRHLRGSSIVPRSSSCLGGPAQDKAYFDAMSLTRKTLSGTEYPLATWTYTYSGYTGGAVPSTKWGQMIDPLGRKIKRTFYRSGSFEGMEQKAEVFPTSGSSSVSEVVDHTYLIESMVGSTYLVAENQDKLNKPRRETNTVIGRGSDTFTTVRAFNTTQSSSLYSHGFQTSVTRSSNASSQTRDEVTVYAHNRTKWVLGLPDTMTRNSKLFYDFDYDTSGRLTKYYSFGNAFDTQEVAYENTTASDPDNGTIKWVENALNKRTSFNNYVRGAPENITFPDTMTVSRVVDVNGWVSSETDENGDTTAYGYNDAGWLASMNPPGTYYDALTRPYKVKRDDIAGSLSDIYVLMDYDALSNETFTSYASGSSTESKGVNKSYDELLRLETVWENVGTSYPTMTYDYLAGNKIKVTDPVGNATTTTIRGFGAPDNGEIVKIEQPEDTTTELTYNNYGNVITVRQHGIHDGYTVDQYHDYYYNSNLRLCRHSVPELNDTLYDYDNAGQMIKIARGQPVGTSCTTPPTADAIVTTYDGRGRVGFVNYPDTSPDIDYEYYPDGSLEWVKRSGIDWTYDWDEIGLLKYEKLDIDGKNYDSAYTYNTSGALLTRNTPANRTINYAPDGFGRSTKAAVGSTNYASGIKYYPGGQIDELTYGNGLKLEQTLNARKLVMVRKAVQGAVKGMDFAYDYFADGRIKWIDDFAVSGQNRDFTYDGQGRLLSADGPWGLGTFKYDAIGNIREKTLGTDKVETQYNSINQLYKVRLTIGGNVGSWKTYKYSDVGVPNRGNVIDNGNDQFVYDRSEQPVTVTGVGTFEYDGNLKRVKQTLNSTTIYSAYGLNGSLLYRDDTTNVKATDYIRVGGESVARLVNGVPKYIHTDHLGSPVSSTDAGDNILWREDYKPFGDERQDPAGNDDDRGFTGHIQDDATGLTYMQARYYDPVVGRFLSNDPVGFSKNKPYMFNRYTYVGNNPINAIDPTGKDLHVIGSCNFRRRINAARSDVLTAGNDQLVNDFQTLEDSPFFHTITEADAGAGNRNLTRGNKADAFKSADGRRGVGTNTDTKIDLSDPDSKSDLASVLTHEVLGHALDKDSGIHDSKTIDEESGLPVSEKRAIDKENVYRDAVGKDKRPYDDYDRNP